VWTASTPSSPPAETSPDPTFRICDCVEYFITKRQVNENGFGRDQTAQGIIDNKSNTLTLDEAKFYVDTSVKYLCPNNSGRS
jgi:hypothetical protein